jgi:cephalosporin-C deacetylase-like acetyl esterase
MFDTLDLKAAGSFISLVFLLVQISSAQVPSQNLAHFDYDASAPLDVKELAVQDRGGVTIHDLTYVSPRGGVVPAYLVVPRGKGKFAGIVWGHWMMPKSPTANRKEFLEEAVALAPAGVVSILIDTPYVRPGFNEDPDPFSSQGPDVVAQQVVDLRRALDLVLARGDVDPKRTAYVGHSFDANCGAVLDGVDERFAAFVFMGNPQSTRDFVLNSTSPNMVAFRKSVPAERLSKYLDAYEWADPGAYAAHLGPAPALFQYATHDDFVAVAAAKHYFEMSSGPKEIKFYDSDHALNADARRDRVDYLRKHLSLAKLPVGTLESVPQTK